MENLLEAYDLSKDDITALAAALNKIEEYTPIVYVDNSEPDINSENLNKTQSGLQRITAAFNKAVDIINDQQNQIITINSNLAITGKLVVYYNAATETFVIRLLTDVAKDSGYEIWLSTNVNDTNLRFMRRTANAVTTIWSK